MVSAQSFAIRNRRSVGTEPKYRDRMRALNPYQNALPSKPAPFALGQDGGSRESGSPPVFSPQEIDGMRTRILRDLSSFFGERRRRPISQDYSENLPLVIAALRAFDIDGLIRELEEYQDAILAVDNDGADAIAALGALPAAPPTTGAISEVQQPAAATAQASCQIAAATQTTANVGSVGSEIDDPFEIPPFLRRKRQPGPSGLPRQAIVVEDMTERGP
jgi:hypothetical protein